MRMEKSDSFTGVCNQDTVAGRGPSNFSSSMSSSGSNTSTIKTYNALAASQEVYSPHTGFYSYYYPGYDGAYQGWNEQGYFLRRDGMEIACSGSGVRSTATQKWYNPKVPLFSKQGCGALHAHCASSDRFFVREKFSRSGTFGASIDMSRGPRFSRVNNSLSTSSEDWFSSVQRDKYNLEDFQTKYKQAMFFVIKSYSEDDIHKSIKYSVWASTSHGNEKLNAAFHDAELRSKEKAIKCPIFLFFSVNASGQFVGLAEMTGQVDFKKTMDFWQLDKWHGFFPLRWHIIKDIPNGQLRHIILANNDNKPVTNSRDTQEISYQQGWEMLELFKRYPAKTSILDDFGFYDGREKLKCRKYLSLPTETQVNKKPPIHAEATVGHQELGGMNKAMDSMKSLLSRTKDLSLSLQVSRKELAGNTYLPPDRIKRN